jgi:hypothetical protein
MKENTPRKSRPITPMFKPKLIKINLVFTSAQFEMVKNGYTSGSMDDKWDIYFENGWLRLVRSWTGIEIYKAQVKKHVKNYIVDEFLVTTYEDCGEQSDDVERDIFELIVMSHLLNDKKAGDRFEKKQMKRLLEKHHK